MNRIPFISLILAAGLVLCTRCFSAEPKMFDHEESFYEDMAFSKDGKQVIVADGRVFITIDIATGAQVATNDSVDRETDLACIHFRFSHDRMTAAMYLADDMWNCTLGIWDTREEKFVRRFPGLYHRDSKMWYAGNRILTRTCTDDSKRPVQYRLWNCKTGKVDSDIEVFRAMLDQLTFCMLEFSFSADGTRCATNWNKNEVRIWQVPEFKLLKAIPGDREPEVVVLSPDGRYVAATNHNAATVDVWDVLSEESLGVVRYTRPWSTAPIQFSPDSSLLAVPNQKGDLYIWDVKKRRIALHYKYPEPHNVHWVSRTGCWSEDSTQFAYGVPPVFWSSGNGSRLPDGSYA